MNRGSWGLQAGLFIALTASAALAGAPLDDSAPTSQPLGPDHGSFINTLGRWFGTAPQPAPTKPKPAPKKPVAKAETPAPKTTPPVDENAVQRERELAALLRRQMVCLKLMQIAADTHDEELQRKAEQLDDRAHAVYTERTAHLPGCRSGTFESDEKTLEKHLGPTDSALGRSAERAFDGRPVTPGPIQARNRGEAP